MTETTVPDQRRCEPWQLNSRYDRFVKEVLVDNTSRRGLGRCEYLEGTWVQVGKWEGSGHGKTRGVR